jgi:hypothetical protein
VPHEPDVPTELSECLRVDPLALVGRRFWRSVCVNGSDAGAAGWSRSRRFGCFSLRCRVRRGMPLKLNGELGLTRDPSLGRERRRSLDLLLRDPRCETSALNDESDTPSAFSSKPQLQRTPAAKMSGLHAR